MKKTPPTHDAAVEQLRAAGIFFEEKSGGVAGTFITIGNPVVRFWPSTQRWTIAGSPLNGRGVESLIRWAKRRT